MKIIRSINIDETIWKKIKDNTKNISRLIQDLLEDYLKLTYKPYKEIKKEYFLKRNNERSLGSVIHKDDEWIKQPILQNKIREIGMTEEEILIKLQKEYEFFQLKLMERE